MTLTVTTLTAAALAALFFALTLRVIVMRRAGGIVLGDGGDRAVAKAIRGQANAAEQIPIFLILLALAEAQGAALLAPVALIFVAGRVAHGLYFGRHGTHWRFRVWGMYATMAAQVAAILLVLTTLL